MAQQKPQRRTDVVCTPAGVETLLYDPASDSVHVLNPTAQAAWELCDGQHTPEEIEAELRLRFSVASGWDVAVDVASLLERLEAEGLLVS
jgi:hypothetical protein